MQFSSSFTNFKPGNVHQVSSISGRASFIKFHFGPDKFQQFLVGQVSSSFHFGFPPCAFYGPPGYRVPCRHGYPAGHRRLSFPSIKGPGSGIMFRAMFSSILFFKLKGPEMLILEFRRADF